jgi:hypothetical protein
MIENIKMFILATFAAGWVCGGCLFWLQYNDGLNGYCSVESDEYKPVPIFIDVLCGPIGCMYGIGYFVANEAYKFGKAPR